MQINCNGIWECGFNRAYDRKIRVPGLAADPRQVGQDELWYRKQIHLPQGNWTNAALLLKGARFCPVVYVNGIKAAQAPGGMAWIKLPLHSPDIRPGMDITLEIALKSLADVDAADASKIPAADLWRSNVSSCLWDDVVLRLHGQSWIGRLIPSYDPEGHVLRVRWDIAAHDSADNMRSLRFELWDPESRNILCTAETSASDNTSGHSDIILSNVCKRWSHNDPVCYELRCSLSDGKGELDYDSMTVGLRAFGIRGLNFELNGDPCTFRAGSVVWHRWVRDPEAHELAWDTEWFTKNIVERLRKHGANGLRFHLGMPPERFLDLCDRAGMLVQVEWSFFHGMKASAESLVGQWRHWLDTCMRHPCVAIIHPWNETESDELKTAFSAIETIAGEYPPLVISHRDVIHIHKYWWSLFENLGIYYDSASQFPMPIVVDEFGGNYLDGAGNPGAYPSIKESFLRFLGRGHTRELRLELQTEANARVAEYWRRIGAAGFSPFCALGSPEDGNHHFLGALADGNPKPVWDALTAAYAPQSCSIDIWDRNFIPGQTINIPLFFFNETPSRAELVARIRIVSMSTGDYMSGFDVFCGIDAFGREVKEIGLKLPEEEGFWRIEAELLSDSSHLPPVVSSWRVRTLIPRVPTSLHTKIIAVPDHDTEVRAFLMNAGLTVAALDCGNPAVIVCGRETWRRIECGDFDSGCLQKAIEGGTSVVMLDVGLQDLGQGYLEGGDLGPLQGVMHFENASTTRIGLFGGISLEFRKVPEPESCIHPSETDTSLWENLDRQSTWLWNGYRGGLVAPAAEMQIQGLSADAFLSLWADRGADNDEIRGGAGMAYELCGFYAFSHLPNEQVKKTLREKVKFLFDDAPALQASINPGAPIRTFDLGALYRESLQGMADGFVPLANAGKNLQRTPVALLSFGKDRGCLVLSQLLTAGRLAEEFGTETKYGVRFDPAACQFVLNMISRTMS